MRRVLLPLVLLALAPVFGGCPFVSGSDNDCDNVACTELYATITVTVVDEAGVPLQDLRTTSTNLHTGEVLSNEDASAWGEGVYAVATDSHTDDVREGGDTIRFRAEGRGLVAEADFVIGTEPCACHIEKVSGPEQITARPE